MSRIVNMNGQPIGTASNQGKITKTMAGAIMFSEVEIAITKWNAHNLEVANGDQNKADTFKIDWNQYEYGEEAKKTSEMFGYALLQISHIKEGTQTVIYTKAVHAKKESDLKNTNGYFPDMMIDCLGFLLASGLMYNLAMIVAGQNPNQIKQDEQPNVQPAPDKKSKPGAGNKRGAGKRNNGLPT